MKSRIFGLFARIQRWGSRLLRRRSDFVQATWRGTLPPDRRTGEQCISFNLVDGRVLRLKLPRASATAVAETLAPGYFLAQTRTAYSPDATAQALLTDAVPRLLDALRFAVRFHDQLTPADLARMQSILDATTGSAR